MFREIKKRKIILENRKPFTEEATLFLQELNQSDWIHSSLRLDGSNLSKETVERILRGEFLVEVSVSNHATIGNYQEAIRLLTDMVDMNMYLSETLLLKVYGTMVKPALPEYRRSNPVLRMLDYNPPHFKEIDEQIALFFGWLHSDLHSSNPIEKAAYIHNKLIEIYPFESGSEAMARMAAQYHLMISGYPPIQWNISEPEYYDAIRLYLKKEDAGPIADVIERGVYNKMEVMMQITVRQ